MRQMTINCLQRIAKYWTTERAENSSDADKPNAGRRSMLLGATALLAGAVFLPGVAGEAEAHSTRRSRRWDFDGRHRRRHSRAHHGRRRSWYGGRHNRRRSRQWEHRRWRSERDYYYHNRRRSRGGPGLEFRFEF